MMHCRLEVELQATGGGHKIININNTNQQFRLDYVGETRNMSALIIVDMEPPTHCSRTKMCTSDKKPPIDILPDLTKVIHIVYFTIYSL